MANFSKERKDELADWIHAIGRWKSRQRKLQKTIGKVEALLREREELVEEALWMRATARTKAEYEAADDALSKAVAMAQDEHEATLQKLNEIYDRLMESHVEELFERPTTLESRPVGNVVDEAGRESFPASDAPSFNPGRA